LGAIQGSDLIDERTRSAKETAIRPVDGYVLEGFQLATNFDSLKTLMMSVVDILPYHKPRFIHGPYQPSEIFEAIECGIDVFDTSHALSATERGLALVYPNGLGFNKRELCSLGNENIIEIDLNNDKYRDSHQPLLDGCNCYTCSNYKSSYIHHLLVTKEMMAGILLMIHNFSHIFKFFHNLRLSIATNRYMEFKSTVLTA
jgi:queuine tRNA-ribosyltransferase subunit QTRTD1